MPTQIPALPAPRERILSTATRLFYTQGVRATGIDQIIAESAVAKATLYYHFPGKTDLIRAYLQSRHETWLAEFKAHLAKSRRRGLPALADALGRWFEAGDFSGCAFINITAESAEDEWRQISCAHKDALRELVAARLPPALSSARRTALAAQALLVIEGMIVRCQMTRDPAVVETGRTLLTLLERCAEVP